MCFLSLSTPFTSRLLPSSSPLFSSLSSLQLKMLCVFMPRLLHSTLWLCLDSMFEASYYFIFFILFILSNLTQYLSNNPSLCFICIFFSLLGEEEVLKIPMVVCTFDPPSCIHIYIRILKYQKHKKMYKILGIRFFFFGF